MKDSLTKNISHKKQLKHSQSNYKPDLDALLSQCELNYRLLLELAPDFLHLTPEKFINVMKIHQKQFKCGMIDLSINVTDVAKYTTTMILVIKSPKIKLTQGIKLIVRLYHDAKMLEVMEGSGPSAIKAIPSALEQKPMDEKQQVNRFLGESLQACL